MRRKLLFFLTLVYLLTRLINLNKLPIFNDEAMYLNWGRLIVQNPKENLFISLTDGQQPFFLWLTSLSHLLGNKFLLLAGRLISVFSGLGTMIVLFFIGKEFLGKRWNIILPILYIITPFTLWYDRLTIKDGFLMFLAALIFYFSIKQARFNQLKWPILTGVVLGVALLTKSIAYFFIGLYPLTALLLLKKTRYSSSDAPHFAGVESRSSAGVLDASRRNAGIHSNNIKQVFSKTVLALAVAFLIQSIAYLSPLKTNIGPKHGVFLLSSSEFIKSPFLVFRNNVYATIMWWWQYYRFLLIPGAFGWFLLFFKNKKSVRLEKFIHSTMLRTEFFVSRTDPEQSEGSFLKVQTFNLWILLNSWIFLPIIFEIFLAKIYIPRYFLFTFIPFSLLVGFGIKLFFSVILRRFSNGERRRIPSGKNMTHMEDSSLDGYRDQNDEILKILGVAVLILLFLPNLFLDYQILFDLKNAKLPKVERWQYLEGWPAGYGIDELIEFFRKELKDNKVNVITENETLIPDSLSLYLTDKEDLKLIKAFDLEKELFFPEEYLDPQAQNFIVLNHFESLSEDWPVKKVASFSRVNNKSEILVYLISL